jgi:hypothetical protein
MAALNSWLAYCGFSKGSSFRDLGDAMIHGKQADTSSCGLFVINLIRHELFGEAIFETKERTTARMELFSTIAEAHMEAVCSHRDIHYIRAHTLYSCRL